MCVCSGKGLEHDRESWRVLDAVNPLGWRMWVTRDSPAHRHRATASGSSFATKRTGAYTRSSPSIRVRVSIMRACRMRGARVYIQVGYNNIIRTVFTYMLPICCQQFDAYVRLLLLFFHKGPLLRRTAILYRSYNCHIIIIIMADKTKKCCYYYNIIYIRDRYEHYIIYIIVSII